MKTDHKKCVYYFCINLSIVNYENKENKSNNDLNQKFDS